MGYSSDGAVHLGFIREPQDIGSRATYGSTFHEGHLLWMGLDVPTCGSASTKPCESI